MITTSQHKYYGSFVDKDGAEYLMHIEVPSLNEDKMITFGPDPMHITWNNEGLFDGAVSKTLSVQIIMSDYDMLNLYTDDPLGVAVKVWKEDAIYFYGFMSCAEYDQSYDNSPRAITFDVLDPIALSSNRKYAHNTTSQRRVLTIQTLLRDFCEEVGITTIYDGTKDTTTKFGEDAFLPEDHTVEYSKNGDWKSWGEVIKGIGTSFGANIFVWADSLYVCPISQDETSMNRIQCYTQTYNGTSWSRASFISNIWLNIGNSLESTNITGTSVSIMRANGCCNVSVDKDSFRSPIPDPYDESRWIGDLSSWPLDNEVIAEESDTKQIRLYYYDTGQSDTQSIRNKDWYGKWALKRTYTKGECTEYIPVGDGITTIIKNVTEFTLESESIVPFHIMLKDSAKRTMPVGYDINDVYVEFNTDTKVFVGGIPGGVANFIIDGTFYKAFREDGKDKSYVRQYYYSLPNGVWGVELYLNYYINRISFNEKNGINESSTEEKLNDNSILSCEISPICRYPRTTKGIKAYPGALSSDKLVKLDTLSRTHRLFKFTTYDSSLDIKPFVSGKFNNLVGQVIGADMNIRDCEYTLSFMINEHTTPAPTPTTWTLVSVNSVTLSSSAGEVTVPSSGGTYTLQVRVSATITDGTQTITYTGKTEGLRTEYGIALYAPVDSYMEIAHEEVEARGYSIIGEYIKFDEWPLSEIDERKVYCWATCNNKRSNNITFTQYPGDE